ncbi:MAG: translation initiation factor IF-2 N-terminal domain-containing protein [Lachnospiraceae bacterium]|nr:translation initiation factor IF-2 N-terminal domain-containing protein [Lachnospiraceae bacterium]
MAKIKVYELAQEIGVKSADILALLKNKGVEVKSHMSVLEDGQAEDVKKALKTPAKSEEAPKTTEKAETSKAAAPKEAKAPAKTGEGTVKKKKSIIFVSNPQNSKMPGGTQIPRKPAHPEKKAAVPAKAEATEPKKTAVPVKSETAANVKPAPAKVENAVEKTVQKPETVETKTAEPVKAETPVRASEPVKAEMPKTPVQRTENRDNNRDNTYNGNRNDGQRRDNGNRNDGQRRDNNRNDGQRRDNNRNDEKTRGGSGGSKCYK